MDGLYICRAGECDDAGLQRVRAPACKPLCLGPSNGVLIGGWRQSAQPACSPAGVTESACMRLICVILLAVLVVQPGTSSACHNPQPFEAKRLCKPATRRLGFARHAPTLCSASAHRCQEAAVSHAGLHTSAARIASPKASQPLELLTGDLGRKVLATPAAQLASCQCRDTPPTNNFTCASLVLSSNPFSSSQALSCATLR